MAYGSPVGDHLNHFDVPIKSTMATAVDETEMISFRVISVGLEFNLNSLISFSTSDCHNLFLRFSLINIKSSPKFQEWIWRFLFSPPANPHYPYYNSLVLLKSFGGIIRWIAHSPIFVEAEEDFSSFLCCQKLLKGAIPVPGPTITTGRLVFSGRWNDSSL